MRRRVNSKLDLAMGKVPREPEREEVVGVSRQELLASLARFQVSPFQVNPDELVQEWERE